MKTRYHLIARFPLTPDILCLQFKVASGYPACPYQAGQYFKFHSTADHWLECSLATPPTLDGCIEVHLRYGPTLPQAQQWLTQLDSNPLVEIEGPFGHCVLPATITQPLLFVAGGTGFAPIGALLSDLWPRKPAVPVDLYWGVSHPRDVYADATIQNWKQRYGLKVHYILSGEAADWQGRRGLVHEAVAADFANLSDYRVYASGPYPMIAHLFQSLKARQLPAKAFFSDMMPQL